MENKMAALYTLAVSLHTTRIWDICFVTKMGRGGHLDQIGFHRNEKKMPQENPSKKFLYI
jgi:hypothetical protein